MRYRIFAAMCLGFAAFGAAGAQDSSQTAFPGWAPTDAMIRIQEKAEAAFEAGKYRKAMWLYSKELAPVGDKYSQYMVAYMHENGLSVPRDPVQAGAWYLLAAERGHEPIVAAAEALHNRLRPEQLAAARAAAESLKAQWGDKELVKRAIRRDIQRLRIRTGTRVRYSGRRDCVSRPGRVFIGMVSVSFEEYCEAVSDRIEARMAYLEGYVTYGELVLLPDEDEEADAEAPPANE